MTHEEAVEKLKILKGVYLDDDGYGYESKLYDDTALALDMAITALEDSRWIPVTERLPEEETDVLVCNKDGKIELTCGSRSTEVDGFIWYTSGWKFGDVIAWMPLPKPYEGSETE